MISHESRKNEKSTYEKASASSLSKLHQLTPGTEDSLNFVVLENIIPLDFVV